MADGPHFEEIEKAQYICNGLTNFTEIWHDDASRPHGLHHQIKF